MYLSKSHCSLSSVRLVMYEPLWPYIRALSCFICIVGRYICGLFLGYILG